MTENNKKSLRIAIVPEHFSCPFTFKKEIFEKHGVSITTEFYPRGTGSMCRALRQKETDIAIALTEGLISDILNNGPEFKIVATYVQSPLNWAVASSPQANMQSVDDLLGKTFGISRFGSGSHLMVYLLAKRHNWNPKNLKFEIKGGLVDLIQGIEDNSTDAFLWETFMLNKAEKENKIKKLGHIKTPWPCFSIAVRSELLETESQRNEISSFLTAIQELCLEFKKNETLALPLISEASHLSIEESKIWFNQVEFSQNGQVSKKSLIETVAILQDTGALPLEFKYTIDQVYDSKICKLVD